MINGNALFADETASYKTPYQPMPGDVVRLVLRTLANDVLGALVEINGVQHKMTKFKSEGCFDYYSFSFKCAKNS